MKTILNPTTEESYSEQVMLIHEQLPATLIADGLQGIESVTVQYWTGSKFVDYMENGKRFQLTENDTGIAIYSPILIRIHKTITVNPVSVYLISYYMP